MQERDDETRAAHPERMTERDRAAVHVHPFLVEAQLPDDGEALRRERLVELDEVDVSGGDARPLEQLADGRNRADAHDPRVDARRGGADERAERVGAQLARRLLARDHERRGAVVDAARIAGRDRAVLAERGLQAGERLGGRLRARVLVDDDVPDRDELVVEPARVVAPRPSAAASGARTRPGPRVRRPTAPRRSRRSRPWTRAGTSPRGAGSRSASRAWCRRRSGRRAGRPCPASP